MTAPDPIARDYLLLVLRLGRLIPGLVDGYFGPPELRALVQAEAPATPSRVRGGAEELRARVADQVVEPDRRRWLAAQLVALETQARALDGDPLPYLEHVTACFDFTPVRTDEAVFVAAAADLERLLPGEGPPAERTAAWDARFTIPPDRLPAVVDALLPRLRDGARSLFGLPAGERLTVSFVRDRPWSGYNWYEGGLRSRVEINTDLPNRAADLLGMLPHETYPGHHLEHAWHEAHLVQEAGRLESSILCINAPECLLSEGLADLGRRFAVPAADEADLLVEVYRLAGLPVARDPAAARAAATTQIAVTQAATALGGVRGNAALLRHADGAGHDEVRAYLERFLLSTPERAEKRLEFIEHPLWRTYVFVYYEGERLLSRWLEHAPPTEQPARFRRLLTEQLTPGAILEELASPAPTR
jgi:hypothetical protein